MYGVAFPPAIQASDVAPDMAGVFAVAWLPGHPLAIAAGKWEAKSFISWTDAHEWSRYVYPPNPAARAVVIAAVYPTGLVIPCWWDGVKDYVRDASNGVQVWHWQWCVQALRAVANLEPASREPAPPTPEEIVSRVVRQYDRDKKLGDYADPDDDE